MKLEVELPDDIPTPKLDQITKAIEAVGGTWNPEEPEAAAPPMDPAMMGQMMSQQGAQSLRPPGLG